LALSPGTRLGVYAVTAQIGEGGMGQVFRAHDTKLNRDVALKILPDAFTSDPDRVARFTREAQTLASLNHPHIAHIYGLEESGGVCALVMELVEGEDLSQRIARGAIPLADALPMAKQIAEALEAAHEQGIIHRDLKPANVKVRLDGTVKVLDFGLAKAMEPTGAASSTVSQSPTITTPAMTQAGMILGTAAYMSPEQAKGRAADRRSDVWAFGVVVYEMLTGQRAFKGEDVSDTLAFILTREPDWATLPADTPSLIRRLLRRCLEKDRKRRLDSAADARLEIEEALTAPSVVESAAASPGRTLHSAWSRALTRTLAASTLGLAIALVLLWSLWRAEKPVDRPLARLDVDLGADVSLPALTSGGTSVAISPDGTRLVYASGTPVKLFTRRLDQPKATELPGTQGASSPFFSPDGQWVGFPSGSKLNKISVEGGAVVPLGDIGSFAGASWGEDGSILASEAFGKGLLRMPAGGGPPETVAPLGNGERGLLTRYQLPQILPGGKVVLFSAVMPEGFDTNTIEALTLADHHRKILVRGGQSARYLPTSGGTGHLVYVNKATLFAIPFDLDKLETRGTAVAVLDDVAYQAQSGSGQFDVSRTGTLVYRRASGEASATMTVQWVDPTGRKEPLRAKPGVYGSPRLSSDGKRLALTVAEGGSQDVYAYNPQRDLMTRLTFGDAVIHRDLRWSPDGQYVMFSSAGNGVFQARADGASQPHALTPNKPNQFPGSFTPDGKRLAYSEFAGNNQIWTVPLEDQGGQLKAGKPEQFLKSSFNDVFPEFSPDGRWLAYQSNESGTFEVYVRAFPPPSSGPGRKWQISNSGGTVPRWSRTRHELMYQSGDQILAASYTVQGDTFVADKPRVWIAKLGGTQWDLAPDGKRVAVLTQVESAAAPKQEHEVVLLQNFFDELRRRVPVGK
jgi:serine/threonine protein kinase